MKMKVNMKNVFDAVKVMVLVVNVIEGIEFIEHYVRSHKKPKTVEGFKAETAHD